MTAMSFLKNLMYLVLSCLLTLLSSMEKIGEMTSRLNPQLNSMSDLDGTISVFSRVLFILKWTVDILHSWGNKVEPISHLPSYFLSSSCVSLFSISKTNVMYVPLIGKPSSIVISLCFFSSA